MKFIKEYKEFIPTQSTIDFERAAKDIEEMEKKQEEERLMKKRREESFEMGNKTEMLFTDLLTKNGIWSEKASDKDDMVNKVDYYIGKIRKVPVQVKALPKSDRGTRAIEFFDVNGRKGWMNSKAELIIFEAEDAFYFIEIKAVWKLLENNLKFYKADGVDFTNNKNIPLIKNINNFYYPLKRLDKLKKAHKNQVGEYEFYTRPDWGSKKRWELCAKVPFDDLKKVAVWKMGK
jgi:hypothetical protein